MAPAWKVGWVQALGGSNPPFSANKSDPNKGSFLLAGFYAVGFERELARSERGGKLCRLGVRILNENLAPLGTIVRV